MRVKQDVVPGMLITTQFVPTTPGTYELSCAELCGMGHYTMGGRIEVHTEEEYEAWIQGQPGWFQR